MIISATLSNQLRIIYILFYTYYITIICAISRADWIFIKESTKHLNKYNVLKFDVRGFASKASAGKVMTDKLITSLKRDLRKGYRDMDFSDDLSLIWRSYHGKVLMHRAIMAVLKSAILPADTFFRISVKKIKKSEEHPFKRFHNNIDNVRF